MDGPVIQNLASFPFLNIKSYYFKYHIIYLVHRNYKAERELHIFVFLITVLGSHFTILSFVYFQFYCLPDNYEIVDSSLDDIKVILSSASAFYLLSNSFETQKLHHATLKVFFCIDICLAF